MKNRKMPMRMCNGCTEMKPKKELIRIVKNKEGEVSVDLTGKKPGRGAYICNNADCLDKAIKSRRIDRNLQIKIDNKVFEKLKEQIV